MKLLTTRDEKEATLLHRQAKRVKNPQATDVILAIQAMKRAAYQWEQETNRTCDGLAAPQIGVNLRIMLLRKQDERIPRAPYRKLGDDETGSLEQFLAEKAEYDKFMRNRMSCFDPWITMINPVLVEQVGTQDSTEGCLSVPGSAYLVTRPVTVFFRYTLPNGKLSGLQIARTQEPNENYPDGDNSAIKFMHEYDHLRGVLISDIAREAYVGNDGLTL